MSYLLRNCRQRQRGYSVIERALSLFKLMGKFLAKVPSLLTLQHQSTARGLFDAYETQLIKAPYISSF